VRGTAPMGCSSACREHGSCGHDHSPSTRESCAPAAN
jgi:hypothetical protein